MNHQLKEVILHIGYGKTGTTALQSALALNRILLLEHGICYPDLVHKGTFMGQSSHNWFVQDEPNWAGLLDSEMRDSFFSQAKQSNSEILLLSAESFSGQPHPWYFRTEDEFWHAYRNKLIRLKDMFIGLDLRLIIYLRRQDIWCESLVNQMIKWAGVIDYSMTSIDNYISVMKPRFDYEKVLDLWTEIFGTNIIVVPYEKAQLLNQDIIEDFCFRLKLPRLTIESNDLINQNLSLKRDVLEFKILLNKFIYSKNEERFNNYALDIINRQLHDSIYDNAKVLSFKQSQSILDSYESSNISVAQKYLNREDGQLFYDRLNPIEFEPPYHGLTVERGLEICMRYYNIKYSYNGKLKYMEISLKNFLRLHIPTLHAILRGPWQLLTRLHVIKSNNI